MSRSIFIAAALALAVALPAAPAQAGAGRTFVSAAGNDSNSCTITLPCRNFAAAYMQTNANGQIDALDPGNYGSLTITGPVSIQGHGWASMSTPPAAAAITINANTGDKISIIGVVLDGFNIANTIGILFNSGGSLTVRDSVIRNFTDEGIQFRPSASTPSQLFVSNTLLSDNGQQGIAIGFTGTGNVTGTLDHVAMQNNGVAGLNVSSNSQNIKLTVSDSVIAGNGDGVDADASQGTAVINVMVRNSTIANNTNGGLSAKGISSCSGIGGDGDAFIRVTRSTITGNASGWIDAPCGLVISYGDNNIDGNDAVNTEPPNPLGYH